MQNAALKLLLFDATTVKLAKWMKSGCFYFECVGTVKVKLALFNSSGKETCLLTRKSSEFDSAFKRRGVKGAAKLRANEKADECVEFMASDGATGRSKIISVKNENASLVTGDDYL